MAERGGPFDLPRGPLVAIVCLGVLQAVGLAGLVLLLRTVIDALVLTPGQLATIYPLIGALAVVALLYAGLRTAEFTLAERLGFNVVRRLRMRMYAHLSGMSVRQLQGRSRGALLLRFTGDLTMFRTWISRGLARGIVATFVLLASSALVAYLSLLMAGVLVGVLLGAAAMSLSVGRRLRRLTRWVRRKRSLLTSNVDEQLAALATVQGFGRIRGETKRLSRQNDSMTVTLIREARVRGVLRGIAAGSTWLALVAVLAVGASEVAVGSMTVGGVVAAMVVVLQMSLSMRQLSLAHDYWQRAQVSRGKLLQFLASSTRPLEEPGQAKLRVRKGRIEISGAHIEGALRGVDAVAEAGQLVALLGPTGAGKSTLLAAIARLAELDSGAIFIDGQDVSMHTLSSMPRQIGLVSPELPLVRGSIRRNLTYRKQSVSDDELTRQVLAWRLDEMLADQPAGLDSWLTEGGGNLSVGQRQRLSLARAWFGNPVILLLDEPSAGLDAESRELFHGLLRRHAGTVLMVTHDEAEAALADAVWELHQGRVVAIRSGDDFRRELEAGRRRTAFVG
jgi:ATP-binding cassette, subfamily B, bacterial